MATTNCQPEQKASFASLPAELVHQIILQLVSSQDSRCNTLCAPDFVSLSAASITSETASRWRSVRSLIVAFAVDLREPYTNSFHAGSFIHSATALDWLSLLSPYALVELAYACLDPYAAVPAFDKAMSECFTCSDKKLALQRACSKVLSNSVLAARWLSVASRHGHYDLVKQILVDKTNWQSSSSLAIDEAFLEAARHGHSEIVKSLIEYDMHSAAAVLWPCDALVVAATHGYPGLVRYLIESDVVSLPNHSHLHSTQEDLVPVFLAATTHGQMAVLQYLCEEAPDYVQEYLAPHRSALWALLMSSAAQHGHFAIVKYLVSRYPFGGMAHVLQVDHFGALVAAVESGNIPCFLYLYELTRVVDSKLVTATKKRFLFSCFQEQSVPNESPLSDWPQRAYISAVKRKDKEMVDALLSRCADRIDLRRPFRHRALRAVFY